MIHDPTVNERNYLGCLLRSPHEWWQTNDTVASDMFAVPHHRAIFEAIRDLSERGKQVTITALQANLPEEFDGAGPAIGVLMALKESAAEAGSATDYAPFLAERSALKRLDALAVWLRKETGKNDRGAEDISAEAGLRLNAIMASSTSMRPVKLGEIVSLVARQPKEDEGVSSGLTTGLTPLDEILGVILGGDLGCILASQGDGKSALAAQIGHHVASSGRPVLYVQLEMSSEQMGARELAAASGLSVAQIHERAFDTFQWEQVADAERALQKPQFFILDTDEITVRQMQSQCMNMQRQGGLSLVIVDQLDKIKAEGKYKDRFERFAELTRDLKKMAKALKVPVIVLAQRTRGAQRRDDARPSVLDADAVSLDRDCDWVLALWQRASHLRLNPPDERGGTEARSNWETKIFQAQGVAEIVMLKHRRRKAHQEKTLRFDGSVMRFREAT